MADKVSVGSAGDNEVSVAEATLLNGIAKYDHLGGYDIKDAPAAVAASTKEVLGDSDAVVVSTVANASHGAAINSLQSAIDADQASSQVKTDISFSVKDAGAGLNTVLSADKSLSHATKVELTNDSGGQVLDITGNISDVSDTKQAMADFASLTSAGRSLVLGNILDKSSAASLDKYSSAMVAIEELNDVISGTSNSSIATAIDKVRAELDEVPNKTIVGGAGTGFGGTARDNAMLMDHGMAKRMDDLFDAMSTNQVAAVQAKIVNTDAGDIIGALNAMGVFDMGSTSGQSDPTTTSYMTKFGQLHTANGADQALVLANADPLDATTMTKVIDAVASLVSLQGVVDGSATDGALLLNAVSDFATKIDTIDSNSTVADALVGVAGYGTSNSASSTTANITAQDVGGAHALLKAMNTAQLNEVLAHTRTLDSTHLADLDSDVAKLMGVQPSDVAGALTAFNALSSARAELVFDTIENVGKLSALGSGKGFEAYVSGPVVTKVAASPLSSGNADEVADADTSTGNTAGLSIAVTFDEAMDQSTTPTLTLCRH